MERNPKEQCKAITLRDGKVIGEEESLKKAESEAELPISIEEKKANSEKETETKVKEIASGKGKDTSNYDFVVVEKDVSKFLYPDRIRKNKLDQQFSKFLEVFKKLQINIPFAEALAQRPSYAKFLKDILSNKRKIEEHGTIMLTEECSAILQNKLPPKLRDPRSFTIPCALGDSFFDKALKPGLREVKETNMSLQLADRSIK
ncbi:uncharacterized protein LOC116133769 [Pistacia vera]|uniref:uncharacterized protein LOC116133769 n=1 Tax=Pistacia vera TaxID=55513 RepID=UPI001263DC33|nr:uncharacterized protein LOC116133769 [Pistacia vera]